MDELGDNLQFIANNAGLAWKKLKREALQKVGLAPRRDPLGMLVVGCAGVFVLGVMVGWMMRGDSNEKAIRKVVEQTVK